VDTGNTALFANSCFGVVGGCPWANRFDRIQPVGASVTAHAWQACSGTLPRPWHHDPVEDPRLRTRVRETILRLKAHEASETELVQSIVTRDLGGGD